MSRISIGVDIEDIGRFAKLDFKKDKLFFDRVYTHREMEYCLSKSNPYPHLAVRFAGKEAVIKVISGFGETISPNEIEMLNDPNGIPVVNMH
jgi:holo-[acyl-carrier protein] synthase